MHSLTRNFDDNDYVDKRGTKEVARFDLDFFDDVVSQNVFIQNAVLWVLLPCFLTHRYVWPLEKLGKYECPRKK